MDHFPCSLYSGPSLVWYGFRQDRVGVIIVQYEYVIVSTKRLGGETARLVRVRPCKGLCVNGQKHIFCRYIVGFLY